MIVWHVTKTRKAKENILKEQTLRLGKNVTRKDRRFVHVSLDPFEPGSWALDVIGHNDTNRGWIFKLEVPDETIFENDPSGDGEHYNGRWVVSRKPVLIVKVISLVYIANIRRWESHEAKERALRMRGFKAD